VLGVSERFACRVTGQHRATQRHEPVATTREDPDAALRDWLRTYAKDHPRRGFRAAYHDARAEGWVVNHKTSNACGVTRACGCRSGEDANAEGTSTAPPIVIADASNRVWAVDFQFDATTDGRPIKIVSVIDEHTRECLGGMVERRITGDQLIDELNRLAAQRGTFPAVLRCDNGPELACSAMADWAAGQVGLSFIPPRRAVAQRLRRIVQLPHRRRVPQHQQLLVTGPARVVISDWKHDYNHHRRHSALDYQPRARCAATCTTSERPSFAV
jgi:putative transposase